MKIIRLTAENVKRLKAVEITPDGNVQVITGRNAQGKTSVLDAIWLALGGGAASRETTRPIRDGEEKASVTLDLGDLTVIRTWTGDKTALTVKSADGAKYGSPQGVLDALVGRLSFDPLEFTRLAPREQVAALLDLVDLDVNLDALAQQRQAAYDSRAEIGRQGKAIGDIPAEIPGTPDVEVSVSALLAEYRAGDEVVRAYQAAIVDAMNLAREIDETKRQIKALEAEAKAKALALDEVQRAIPDSESLPDLGDVQERIDTAETTNEAVRHNAQVAQAKARKAALTADYQAQTAAIETIDATKAAALAGAKFPVDGLGFDDGGVTYRGIPFSQASSAEQIRVSLAMAMSLNPKLRVIRILDGSLLDPDNLALIGEMASDQDYQVWIERVGDASSVGVVIEDGAVA
jgi:hypothetical protein